MEAIYIEGMNADFAKEQKQYVTLPAHRNSEGVITSCWKLTILERLKVLFSGKIYLQLMTFNKPLQPQKITVDNPIEA